MAHPLISCDDHLDLGQLPPDLWTTRLPAALRDRAPFISERNGQPVWICDGKVWGNWAGKKRDPNAPRINNGITGDARPSTPELGKRIYDMKVDYAIRQMKQFTGAQSN